MIILRWTSGRILYRTVHWSAGKMEGGGQPGRWAKSVHGGLSIQPSGQRPSAVNRGIITGNVSQKSHVDLANRKNDIDRVSIQNKTTGGGRNCINFLSFVRIENDQQFLEILGF